MALTKTALEQENRVLTAENTRLRQLLQDVVAGSKPVARESARVDVGETHEFQLFRPAGAAGGLVLSIHRVKMQTPYIDAHYLDDLFPFYGHPAIRTALEKLREVRNAAQAETKKGE